MGNLRIPGYELPWEDASYAYPNNLASPLQIEVEASNGASDYGNKFGEPVIQGFTRSFGLRLPDGERREWLKPIMFSAGIGQMDARHTEKTEAQKGMLVVKIGGPAYRIGMGGGAASSMIQGENVAELDFNAVQRGDAEMEQKMNRVIRACVELGEKNPDPEHPRPGRGRQLQRGEGDRAPGRGEDRDPEDPGGRQHALGARDLGRRVPGAERAPPDRRRTRRPVPCRSAIARRCRSRSSARSPATAIIVLYDEMDSSTPENLELAKVLGDMPQKIFKLDRKKTNAQAARTSART